MKTSLSSAACGFLSYLDSATREQTSSFYQMAIYIFLQKRIVQFFRLKPMKIENSSKFTEEKEACLLALSICLFPSFSLHELWFRKRE